MLKTFTFFIHILIYFTEYSSAQISPSYDLASCFYVGEGTVVSVVNRLNADFTFQVPSAFPISTASHRHPFHAVTSLSDYVFQDGFEMDFYTQTTSLTSTSFFLQIYVMVLSFGGVDTNWYGFVYGCRIKFRYMLVINTFPNKYICQALVVTSVPFSVSGGGSKQFNFSVTSLVSPAPLTLSSDTVFLHAFTYTTFQSTKSLSDNSFQLNFAFIVNTPSSFGVQIHAKWSVSFDEFEIKVFIYNKLDFDALYVKFEYQIINFNNLPLGTGSQIIQSLAPTYKPLTNEFFYGLCGFQFSQYSVIAFQFLIDLPSQYNIVLNSLNSSAAITNLQLIILLTSQFRCPNGELAVDSTLSSCFTSCPTKNFQTTQQVGITGIFICQTCDATCGQCSKISSNCTSCDPAQFRGLVGTSCLPITHYYDDGVNVIAAPCDSTCKQCSGTSTFCTSCQTDAYLSSGNACVACSTYDVECLTCNTTSCASCNSGFVVQSTGGCIACVQYHIQCSNCNGTSCVTCNTGFYQSGIACIACTTYDVQCLACSPTSCTSCNAGLIVQSTGGCIACVQYHAQCTGCNGTSCVTCTTGFYQSGTACSPCTSYHAECNTCSTTSCTACTVGFYVSGTACASCQTYHTQCLECSTFACTLCGTGYQVSGIGACVTCTDYHLECLTCSGTTCQSCATLYAVQGISCVACSSYHLQCTGCDASVCNQCNSGFYVNSGSCSSCSSSYNAQCLTCDNTQCFTCQTDYFVDPTTLKCLPLLCGDGIWVDADQACDDGNLDNNDGCDSQCQAESDYACLLADKLPSGASLCKYTKEITVDFSNLQKDLSSNVVHLFFDLQPPTFKGWDQQMIQDLLMPVQIVDSATGAVTAIPYDSMTFSLHQNPLTNQVQITIDYGQSNLEDSYLKFNVDPSQTSNPALQDLSAQNNLYLKLNSGRNGVNLYGYSQDTYDFQGTVQSVATMVGLVSLAMVLIGLCVPAGKLIILEALAVVQITFFSVLQFEKVPPTFAGFKNLILSNGYNDPSIFASNSDQNKSQDTYNLIGLSSETISNYNISFGVLFLLPALIGFIGYVINSVSKSKNQLKQQLLKSQHDSQLQKRSDQQQIQAKITSKQLLIEIFQRILFELSFYGLLICSYLYWISILHSFSSIKISGLITLGLMLTLTIVYSYLFFRNDSSPINLKKIQSNTKNNSKQNQSNLIILTKFGEFSQIHKLISNDSNFETDSKALKKIYFIVIIERVLTSALISLLYFSIDITSFALIAQFLVLLVGLIILYKKCQNKFNSVSMFSYLYKNYVLRQSINYITIILIEIAFLFLSIMTNTEGPQKALSKDQITIKVLPIIILSLVALNLIWNIFLWCYQIKQQNLLVKSQLILSLLFPSLFSSKSANSKEIKSKIVDQVSKCQKQEDQVSKMLQNFIKTSPVFKPRNSPFLGMEQKVSKKDGLLNMFKLESNTQGVGEQHSFKLQMEQQWGQL